MRRRWLRLAVYAKYERASLAGLGLLTLTQVALDALKPWPMKLLVDSALSGKPLPQGWKWVGRLPAADAPAGLLGWLTASLIVLWIVSWGERVWLTYVQTGAGLRLSYRLGGDLFQYLQRLSLRFHGRQPTGDLVKRVTGDSNCARDFLISVLVPLIISTASLGAMFMVMWRLDRSLSLLALCASPLLLMLMKILGRRMSDRTYEQLTLQGKTMAFAERTLTNLPAVRAFAREDEEDRGFAELSRRGDAAYLRVLASELQFKFGVDSITAVSTAAIMAIGGWHVLAGQISIGTLLVFLSYLASLYGPLSSLAYLSQTFASAGASARRVFEILEAQEFVQEAKHPRRLGTAVRPPRIELRHVSVGYERERPVLRDVSIEALPGQMVALVGPTGAGKSTLVSLIPRFLDPWEGAVLYDGQDLRGVGLEDLRSRVAIVLQDTFLLPLTIAENIGYGRPGSTREAIVQAAIAANADRFIKRLPQGYETVLDERGANLSGGERQRISIARALLKNPNVLILDEPTSALDLETEASVLEALERLMENRTTFIIAHRLSTIRRADRIVVLDRGRVIESNSHRELMQSGGLYRQLHDMQYAGTALGSAD